MDKKSKQDKESATDTFESPDWAETQAGNPLCRNECNNVTDNRSRRYIRITDIDSWSLIDKISKDKRYANSFNKIINDALFYGLPMLYKNVFEEVKLEEAPMSQREHTNLMCFNEKQFGILVRLLKETVLNVTINKSILSSLFHVKDFELDGLKVDKHKFLQGLMSDTPDYLNDYEIRGLKSLRK